MGPALTAHRRPRGPGHAAGWSPDTHIISTINSIPSSGKAMLAPGRPALGCPGCTGRTA